MSATLATPQRYFELALRLAGQILLWVVSGLGLLFLYLPIFILVLYSFNTSRVNAVWRGFTWDWYRNLFADVVVRDGGANILVWEALQNSLVVGTISTLIATVMGTAIGLAMERFRFRGRSGLEALLFCQLSSPTSRWGSHCSSFSASASSSLSS